MPSPTFNLVLRYDGRDGGTVLHVDLFRLTDPDEVWELGWSELGEPGEIALVEWPERAGELLPPARWDIRLEPVEDPLLRRVSATAVGNPPGLPE
jgi:tRNA A37 threonylcarbamoyladenosine biosynthesis protein TsaE